MEDNDKNKQHADILENQSKELNCDISVEYEEKDDPPFDISLEEDEESYEKHLKLCLENELKNKSQCDLSDDERKDEQLFRFSDKDKYQVDIPQHLIDAFTFKVENIIVDMSSIPALDSIKAEIEKLTNASSGISKALEEVTKELNEEHARVDDFIREHKQQPLELVNLDSDSDDDVQFIEMTFDPSKAKKEIVATATRLVRIRFPNGTIQSYQVPLDANVQPYLNTLPEFQRAITSGPPVYMAVERVPSTPIAGDTGHYFVSSSQPTAWTPMTLPSMAVVQVQQLPPMSVDGKRFADTSTLKAGIKVFGRKTNEIWYRGTIIENKDGVQTKYKVKFDGKGQKQLTSKTLAQIINPLDNLVVGTRVVAQYRPEKGQKIMFAGIVAEPPGARNTQRYLIFFDDGYAQYCHHEDLHLVYEQSAHVWDDVTNNDSKEFVRNYLNQYPERPMVRLFVDQPLKVEWEGRWWDCKVKEVDASLVKVWFMLDEHVEWIYRGSTRLEPLYNVLVNTQAGNDKITTRRGARRLPPNKKQQVEFLRVGEEAESASSGSMELRKRQPRTGPSTSHDNDNSSVQPVPKKSTGKRASNAKLAGDQEVGAVESCLLTSNLIAMGRKLYVEHMCGPHCIKGSESVLDKYKLNVPITKKNMGRILLLLAKDCVANPLLIPQLLGWERHVSHKLTSPKKLIVYRTPCGRRLRSLTETDQYLYITISRLTIDLFSFDAQLRTAVEYVPKRVLKEMSDLSHGKETVNISCVNCMDDSLPDFLDYSNERIATADVHLNLDEEFLSGCDCQDGCRDPMKCACIQLTIEAATAQDPDAVDVIGYNGRRLREHVVTGIYECNKRCKCDSRCHNRVVQNGLSLRLQVFKTENRGWGVRCLDDIPKGTFVSTFTGKIMDESLANKEGQQYGDEYLAELDYIEVVERNKEGYESDVVFSDDEEKQTQGTSSDYQNSSDSDSAGSSSKGKKKRSSKAPKADDNNKKDTNYKKNNGSNSNKRKTSTTGNAEAPCIIISDDEETSAVPGPSSTNAHDDNKLKRSERLKSRGKKNKKSGKNESDEEENDEEEEEEQEEEEEEEEEKKKKFISARTLFGEEYCYVMDAKNLGNIGRYLNHSCSPNVFVQNVFVDTHDLRFPWVAFFAAQFICAGTELTWDYNYEVGSVPGKVLHCYCGSSDCRGRLL